MIIFPIQKERFGTLVRAKCDRKLVAYIVALADPAAAIDLIRKEVGGSDDEFQDVARVSDGLLRYLKLQSGEFMRVDEADYAVRVQRSR
jgi:hypothetical protein